MAVSSCADPTAPPLGVLENDCHGAPNTWAIDDREPASSQPVEPRSAPPGRGPRCGRSYPHRSYASVKQCAVEWLRGPKPPQPALLLLLSRRSRKGCDNARKWPVSNRCIAVVSGSLQRPALSC